MQLGLRQGDGDAQDPAAPSGPMPMAMAMAMAMAESTAASRTIPP